MQQVLCGVISGRGQTQTHREELEHKSAMAATIARTLWRKKVAMSVRFEQCCRFSFAPLADC